MNFCCTSTQFQIGQQHGNCKSKAISQTAKMIPVASIFYYVFRDLYDAKKQKSIVVSTTMIIQITHKNTSVASLSSRTTNYTMKNACLVSSHQYFSVFAKVQKIDNKIFAYSGF